MEQDITHRISTLLGREQPDIEALTEALATAIRSCLNEGDEVALPSLGTFVTIKEDEHIITDLSSGDRLLMPPCIIPKFKPSSILRRRISNHDKQ